MGLPQNARGTGRSGSASLGVDAAEAEADMEFARLRDLEDTLVAMPAFTPAGMSAKALVVDRVYWGCDV